MTETVESRRQGRSSAWALIGTAVGAAANFALLLVVIAAYGQTLFGVFAAVTAAFALSAVLFRLGADVGGTYAVARLRALDAAPDARRVLVAAVVPVAVLSTAVALVAFVAADPISRALTEPADTAEYRSMLRVIAFALPFASVGEVLLGATRGFASMRPTVIANNFGRQVGQLVAVAIAAAADAGIQTLALAWALPYLLTVIYPAWWLHRALTDMGTSNATVPWADFWRYTTPQASNAAVQGGLEKADIIMLGRMSGADATAVYSVANRFVHVVVLARYALNVSQAADLASGFEQGDLHKVHSLAVKVATWTAMLCAPVLWAFVVFPEAILGVVGAEYEPGASSLRILALAVLAALLIGPVESMLLMSGSSLRVMLNNAAALTLNIGLNLWLIPEHGPTGAAVAWAASLLLARLLSLWPLQQRYSLSAFDRPLLVAAGIAAASIGGVGLVVRTFTGDTILGAAVTAVVGGIAMFSLLFRSRRTVMVDDLVAGLVGSPTTASDR